MATGDEVKDAIATDAAAGIKRVRSDEMEVEQQQLKDRIEAARFVSDAEAASTTSLGLRFARLVPPGAV